MNEFHADRYRLNQTTAFKIKNLYHQISFERISCKKIYTFDHSEVSRCSLGKW